MDSVVSGKGHIQEAVALYDGRCQEAEGMVGGFLTRHRWLERVRSAGPLLMASYGRWAGFYGYPFSTYVRTY